MKVDPEGPIRAVIAFAHDVSAMLNRLDAGSNVVIKKWPEEVERTRAYVITVSPGGSDEAVLRYLHNAGVVGRFTLRGVGTVWHRRATSS